MPRYAVFTIINILFILNCTKIVQGGNNDSVVKAVLNKCPNFKDYRNSSAGGDITLLTIPVNLTNSNETVNFGIERQEYRLPCSDNYFETIVKWEDGRDMTRFKSSYKGERLLNSGKSSSHFTHEGYFHEETHYYSPKDYCIKSISETEIELKICNVSCNGEKSTKICIPKCCGVDEILIYWNFTCRKKTAQERKWKPKVHQTTYPHKEIVDNEALDNIHIFRQKLNCQLFDQWPLSDTLRAKIKDEKDQEVSWKLLPNKRPVYLTNYRKWLHIPEGEYCIDGYANWGYGGNGTYSGNENEHSVLLICPSSNSSSSNNESFNSWRAWTYSGTLVVSSFFLLLTVIIHLMLLDKQHLHGLTVLCHSVSMFFFYIFCAIAHIYSIFPEMKGKQRSWHCLTVAILSHYFFMSSFTWLSIMNFDLFLTFRSMRPISKMSKRFRRFRLYTLIGWGLPAILSGAFYTIDEVYRERKTEVVVPDYADKNCFVAIWARGYYMYSLVAIALSFNTVLVLWTFHIFYEFRKQNTNTFTTRRTKSDKYSVRLFTKLFCVMGVFWFVELISWYYNGDTKPWYLVILDCCMFLQAFAIFFIFCINRRTLKQLEEKYPCMKKLIGPIRVYTWFKYSDADGVEMTTPGSTPRKLSLSVTTNTKIDSTLPRKVSTSSARSCSTSSNNKYIVNGKGKVERMESINLDSDTETGVMLEPHHNNANIINQAPDLITNT